MLVGTDSEPAAVAPTSRHPGRGVTWTLPLPGDNPSQGSLFTDRTVSRLVGLILSSRHLLSPQLAASWCPAWPRTRHQRGPLPRLRLSVRPGPRPGPASLGATPPQAGGGLLERVCPVEAFSIVPRRLAGGLRPAPLGRRCDGKAQSVRSGNRRMRLCVSRSGQNAPFGEKLGQNALFREAQVAECAFP